MTGKRHFSPEVMDLQVKKSVHGDSVQRRKQVKRNRIKAENSSLSCEQRAIFQRNSSKKFSKEINK